MTTSCCTGPICRHRQVALLMTLNKRCKYGPVQCSWQRAKQAQPSKTTLLHVHAVCTALPVPESQVAVYKRMLCGCAASEASCVSVQVVSIFWILLTGNACCIDATIKVTLICRCFLSVAVSAHATTAMSESVMQMQGSACRVHGGKGAGGCSNISRCYH